MNKRIFYTDDKGLHEFENGYVFYAKHTSDKSFKHQFTVNPGQIIEETEHMVIIDTGSGAEFI